MDLQFCSLQNFPKAVGLYTELQRDLSYLSSWFQFPKVHTSKLSAHCLVFPKKKMAYTYSCKWSLHDGLVVVSPDKMVQWLCLLPLDLDFQNSWPVNKLFLNEVSRAES